MNDRIRSLAFLISSLSLPSAIFMTRTALCCVLSDESTEDGSNPKSMLTRPRTQSKLGTPYPLVLIDEKFDARSFQSVGPLPFVWLCGQTSMSCVSHIALNVSDDLKTDL